MKRADTVVDLMPGDLRLENFPEGHYLVITPDPHQTGEPVWGCGLFSPNHADPTQPCESCTGPDPVSVFIHMLMHLGVVPEDAASRVQ